MWQVFFQIFKRDLLIFRRDYSSKFLDMLVLFATNVVVFGYFMPGEGLSSEYGPFLVIAAIGSFGLIEVVGKIAFFLSDLEGEKSISQLLIMPIPSFLVFVYIIIFWAVSSMLLSAFLFPFGKLMLFSRFDLTTVSYLKLIPIFFLGNVFFGSFGLWLCSIIPSMSSLNAIWLRYVVPLWMFGTYFFSWKTAYATHPTIGSLLLLNPIVYVIEGMRAACLGQTGYLPYWTCLTATLFFTILCGYFGIKRLKKRLDCI